MLQTVIAIIVVIAIIILWAISKQRKLAVLDENVLDAMNQIGLQLSNRYDALMALLELTKCYAKQESEALVESIKTDRRIITDKSTQDDLLCQEEILTVALSIISIVAEQYPELLANKNYIKAMDDAEALEKNILTSRLIYNHSVTKLNGEIRIFPVSMIAGVLGFHQREYLEERLTLLSTRSARAN